MVRRLSVLLLLLLTAGAALADEVEIGAVPQSAEEFLELRGRLAGTPEGGAACFVAALLAFSKSPEVGLQCLTLAIDQRNVGRGDVYKGYAPIGSVMYHVNRISGYQMWPYLGYAYVKGATAEHNYEVSPPLAIETYRQKNSGSDAGGQVKVFVKTDGFRARPVTMRRNDKGIWKAYEFSSLLLNVNPPKSLTPSDNL